MVLLMILVRDSMRNLNYKRKKSNMVAMVWDLVFLDLSVYGSEACMLLILINRFCRISTFASMGNVLDFYIFIHEHPTEIEDCNKKKNSILLKVQFWILYFLPKRKGQHSTRCPWNTLKAAAYVSDRKELAKFRESTFLLNLFLSLALSSQIMNLDFFLVTVCSFSNSFNHC